MKVNIISETPYTIDIYGVHSVFLETKELLEKIGVEVKVNSKEDCDIIHIHSIGPYSFIKSLKNKGKAVMTAHYVPNTFLGSFILARFWLPLGKLYLRIFYNRADAIIAVSPKVKEELTKIGVKRKIYVVPNSVNLERFKIDKKKRQSMRSKLNLKENDFVVLNSGQIQPRKDVETFVNIARKLPNIKFIWVGGIPFKHLSADYSKMKKIQKETPENVHFVGVVPFDKMPSYYNIADMFFFPSLQETFGLVIIEAAAYGLPLLIRNLEIYSPLFEDYCIKGNENNFASVIKKLEKDKLFYDEYQKKAFQIAQKYDSRKIAKKIIHVYKKVIENYKKAKK